MWNSKYPFLYEANIRNVNTLSFKYTDGIYQCVNWEESFWFNNNIKINSQVNESTRKESQLSFQITQFETTKINVTKKSENFYDWKFMPLLIIKIWVFKSLKRYAAMINFQIFLRRPLPRQFLAIQQRKRRHTFDKHPSWPFQSYDLEYDQQITFESS